MEITQELVPSKELAPLKAQVSKLENQAHELIIASPEDNAKATELKAKLREIGKIIKDRKEAITKPLNIALKSARELFAPLEEHFANVEVIVARKLLDYKAQVEKENREKEVKIAARGEKGTLKIETAERKIGELEHVEKTIQTTYGQVQFRKIKKVRVVDESKIPDEYWVLDMVAIRRDALNGTLTGGVEIYEEEIV